MKITKPEGGRFCVIRSERTETSTGVDSPPPPTLTNTAASLLPYVKGRLLKLNVIGSPVAIGAVLAIVFSESPTNNDELVDNPVRSPKCSDDPWNARGARAFPI